MTLLLKNKKVIKNEIMAEIISDNITIAFASTSLLGNTIAFAYVKEPTD